MPKKKKQSNRKDLILGLIIIFVIVAFFSYFKDKVPNNNNVIPGQQSLNKSEVVIIFDFGGTQQTRKFKMAVAEDQKVRVWSLLQQAAAYGNISLAIEDGFVPTSINGVSSVRNGKTWNFYLNSEKQALQPFDIFVRGGDEVVFKYE